MTGSDPMIALKKLRFSNKIPRMSSCFEPIEVKPNSLFFKCIEVSSKNIIHHAFVISCRDSTF